jgi:cytochrome c peroxidase
MKLFFAICVAFLLFSCGKGNKPEPETDTDLKGSGLYSPDIPSYFEKVQPPKTGNLMTYEGVRLGRRLFYEKKMSVDNEISCGSCHRQELAFTDGRAFAKGFRGQQTAVSSMMLANLIFQTKFHWNGKFSHLEDQALAPIVNPIEMNQSLEETIKKLSADPLYPPLFEKAFGSREINAERISFALSQFVRTLISKDSKFDRFLRGEVQLSDSERRGMQLFITHPVPEAGIRGANCGDCHLGSTLAGSTFDFRGFHNNGLDDDASLKAGLKETTGMDFDRGKFKAVSLRNIALTAPYMHDGRFNSLEEVIEHYDSHVKSSRTLDPLIMEASNEIFKDPLKPFQLHLTREEKKDLLNFLHTLTDSVFIKNPHFSDPFKK